MRHAIERLQGSLIREIANAGMGRPDVLAFWFGESDEVTPEVIRRAAIESLERGETFYAQNLGLPELRAELACLKTCRDTLVPLLAAIPGVQVAVPRGGMYAFFRIAGFDDSLAVARRLVVEAGLGLAPGAAFAPESGAWLRWCFAARDTSRLVEGVRRLREWLAADAP